MTAFGKLEVVAVQDLGEMGPARGEAVPLNAGVGHVALALAPWLLMIALIANRRRRAAWLALIPLIVFGMAIPFVLSLLRFNGKELVGLMVMTLAMAVAAWWLLPGCGRANFFLWLIRGTLIYLAVFAVSFFSYAGGMARDSMPAVIYTAIGVGSVALAAVLTRLSVRRRPTTGRTMLAFAVYAIVSCFLVIGVCIGILCLTNSSARRSLSRVLPQIALAALMFGVAANLVMQPYLLLACVSDFWRDSMRRLFRLPEPAAQVEPAPPAEPDLQESEQV